MLDNIDMNVKREEPWIRKGQTIRNELYYEELFVEAGLTTQE